MNAVLFLKLHSLLPLHFLTTSKPFPLSEILLDLLMFSVLSILMKLVLDALVSSIVLASPLRLLELDDSQKSTISRGS